MNNNILIVEDELITAESIAALLIDEDYEVAGPVTNAADAIAICEKSDSWPAVALCDINIKGPVKGTELALELKKRFGCEIVFLTAYSDRRSLSNAFESDPAMYVLKPYTDKQLLVAIQLAFHKLLKKETNLGNGKLNLTEREAEIAGLVADGFSSKQIARKLFISAETVKTHRRNMLQKNNMKNFPQLVFLMQQNE